MSHSSEEAAAIATGCITEAAFEEALAQVEREDGAPVPLKLKKVGQEGTWRFGNRNGSKEKWML